MSLVNAGDRVPPEVGVSRVEPEDWVEALSVPGPRQDRAMSSLHQMMLRACRHQVRRMRSTLAGVGNEHLEEIANQAADEAMMSVLAKLPTFEGRSRFTTWAYKFAILQSATEVRRYAWHNREVELKDDVQVAQAHGTRPVAGEPGRGRGPGLGGSPRDRRGPDAPPAPGHHRPADRRRSHRRSRRTTGHEPQRAVQDRA